jgi:hypothetical protein
MITLEDRAELAELARTGSAGAALGGASEPTGGVECRRACSVRNYVSKGHRRPFCRSRSPARRTTSATARLPSPSDASLSVRGTCPEVGRGTGPAEPRAAAERVTSCDMQPRRDEASHVAGPGGIRRRTVAPDRNGRRIEAGSHTARMTRADTLPTTRGPMPPTSGHGAPAVVIVTASDGFAGDPRRPRVPALGPSLISASESSTPPPLDRPRSTPVNGDRRRSPDRGLHRVPAGSDDHRHFLLTAESR